VELRLLEYFLAAVDRGGVTKAAEALYVAQPSLSQAIRGLERELGVELFDRSRRRLTLTDAGRAFAVTARKITKDVERARAEVHAVRDLASGRLELAAVPTLEVDLLPELAARMLREHPGIVLSVTAPDTAAQVANEVRHGRAELGLAELPVKADNLLVYSLGTQEIVLALPSEMAAGLPDPVPVAVLAGMPLISAGAGIGTVPEAATAVVIECGHRPMVWELVRRGAGAALLPRRLAERQLPDVVVRALSPRADQAVGMLSRVGPLSPAARAFLQIAEPKGLPS
jgi:DNA-binding transcriptional LysR family regulator